MSGFCFMQAPGGAPFFLEIHGCGGSARSDLRNTAKAVGRKHSYLTACGELQRCHRDLSAALTIPFIVAAFVRMADRSGSISAS